MTKLIAEGKLISVVALLAYAFVCYHTDREFNAALSALGAFVIFLDHKITMINIELKKLDSLNEEE